jgi:uncharacterized protein YecT (DUF1311 family)
MLILFAAALLSVGQDPGPPPDCANAANTIEINECAAADVAAEEDRMAAYLAAAVEVLRKGAESLEPAEAAVADLLDSQTAWRAYADSACGAVHTRWLAGTIRTLMALNCQKRLTRQRSHTLWTEYLTHPDGTPSDWPDPSSAPEPVGD